MSAQTYTCADCGETFTAAWSNDEAMAESIRLWGNVPPDNLVVVCDDCFHGVVARAKGGAA